MTTSAREQAVAEIMASMDALRNVRMRSFCAQPLHRDISLPQLHVLATLQESGNMTVSELANLLGISMPSASSIVDRMEERALVSRTRDLADRRVVTVEITPHGMDVAEEFMGLKREQMKRLFDSMTDIELRNIIRGIESIRAALSRDGLAIAQESAVVG